MIFIDRSRISFHIIAINFIVVFSLTSDGFDSLFIIMNKFFKWVLFILGRVIYNVAKWADLLLVVLIQYE